MFFYEWDLKSDHVSFSAEAERLFGLPAEELSGPLDEMLDRVVEADRPRVRAAFRNVAERGEPLHLTCRFLRPDGTNFSVETEGQVVETDTSKRVIARAVRLDSTTDVERVALSSERFRLIFRTASIGLGVVDASGTIVEANPALHRLLGYNEGELPGRTVEEITFPGDVETRKALPYFEELLAGERAEYEVEKRYRRKDGTTVWARVNATAICDDEGNPLFNIGIIEDISQKKAMQKALEESEQRFRSVFENAPVGFSYTSEMGQIGRTNRALQELLGRSEEELLGMSVAQVTHPEDLKKTGSVLEDLQSGGKTRHLEKRYVRPDGEVVWADVTVTSLPRDDGGFWSIAVIQDRTEWKRMEEELRNAQKLEAIGRLAGGIAHDFNNLLTGLRGYVDLARKHADRGQPIGEELTAIERVVDQASDLVRQLLAFGRQQMLKPEIVDLSTVVRDLQSFIRRTIQSSIDLRYNLTDVSLPVEVDPGQMQQVVMNLILNARDSFSEAEGTIWVETDAIEIKGQWDHDDPPDGQYARLRVLDDGTGMDEETQRRIFEPFYTTKGEGTGLGLATVYGIVKQSGGYIRIESSPKRGSCFEILLPLESETKTTETETKSEAEPTTPLEGAAGLEATILLCEDEAIVREVVFQVLSDQGFEVVVAESGEEAIREATDRGEAIDLLLTDIVMPGRDGYETATLIQEELPDLPVLYMSGHSDRAAEQGIAAPFLRKPFRIDQLLSAVRDLLTEES